MTIDTKALANLARLDMSESEAEAVGKEIASIIGFVDAVQSVVAQVPDAQVPEHRNIFREDAHPHEPGIYTRSVVEAAPEHTDTHVRVGQVIATGRYNKA